MNDKITEKVAVETIAHIKSLGFTKVQNGKYKAYKNVLAKHFQKAGTTLFVSIIRQVRKGQEFFLIGYWETQDGQPWWRKINFQLATHIHDIGRVCEFATQKFYEESYDERRKI